MKYISKTLYAILLLVGLFASMNILTPPKAVPALAEHPEELRAVWAATVFGLDYPQKPTTSAGLLRRNADKLLDRIEELDYNTVFLQVRPSGDAFYKSDIFPWSKYLTGVQGTAPADNFDPLEYFTEEAHKRGISVHAWLNPYRLTLSAADETGLSENSIAKKYAHLTVKHTDGRLYLNPGEPESIELTIKGVQEIIQNYDIDGIHIDDYFYPDTNFPDADTFAKYGTEFSDIGDWRRHNTTSLVRELHNAIKAEDENLIFSVSPCGIWANKSSHPDGSDTSGAEAYYEYFADTRLWVKENLMDWIIPQIYWYNGFDAADFRIVSDWWSNTVKDTNVRLCIGQAVYKSAEETNPDSAWYGQKGIDELTNQTAYLRNLNGCIGYAHYRLGCVPEGSATEDFVLTANSGKAPQFTDLKDFLWAKDAILTLTEKGIIKGMGNGTFGGSAPVSRADFTLMLVRLLNGKAVVTDNFSDVSPDKYYYDEIGIAKALGITNGRDGIYFDPEGKVTREEMATLVYRVLKKEGFITDNENMSLTAKFTDGNEVSEYAETAVKAIVSTGLLSGYETGKLRPQGFATRAETAVFLNKVREIIK
ncbi:MAG: family 10 glycosylhydrolase [Clostridia bacterium]|nr:family 10 glycosylhydrolase [Clostridia bacterium]